jgi:ABC-type uncharacterized transport system permease subunit
MGYEDAFKVLGDIASADGLTYGIVAALTLIVFVIMRTMLPVKSLAIAFAPAIFLGGLAGDYAASIWGFVVVTEKSANIAAGAALGMIAALVVMVVLMRLFDWMTRSRKPFEATPVPAPRNVRI